VDPGILLIKLYRHQVTKVSHQDNRPCKEGHSSQKPLHKSKSHISTLQKFGRLRAGLTTDHLEPRKYTEKTKTWQTLTKYRFNRNLLRTLEIVSILQMCNKSLRTNPGSFQKHYNHKVAMRSYRARKACIAKFQEPCV
jgi:hypothetical protein